MDLINALAPSSLLKSVSNAGSEISRRVWTPSPPPQRPFRVCDHKRNVRKGLMASTLGDLLDKARETLLMSGLVFLVLEEDGTLVETEEFFQILEDNTALMVLEKGQKWTHSKANCAHCQQLDPDQLKAVSAFHPSKSASRSFALTGDKPRNSRDIARITFDIYKLNPRDLFGSLNVSATFYGLYSMSCDFKCLGPKKVLREILRVASTVMQGVGHLLLGASNYIRRLLDSGDGWHPQVKISNYQY